MFSVRVRTDDVIQPLDAHWKCTHEVARLSMKREDRENESSIQECCHLEAIGKSHLLLISAQVVPVHGDLNVLSLRGTVVSGNKNTAKRE